MLSLKNNFVFVHVPKTGGNSLQAILEKHSDDQRSRTANFQDLINTFDVKGPVTGKKHFTSAEYIERLGLDSFMRLKKVTFVRHPLDRALSFYFAQFRWMGQGFSGARPAPSTFDKQDFLALLGRIGTATSFLSHQGRLIDFDVVGRFETYAADFSRILQTCGVQQPPGAPPHVNRGLARPVIQWDKEMLDAVESRFEEDFRNFGYDLKR